MGRRPGRSFLGVPLTIEDRPSGSLYLTDKQTGSFDDDDESAATAIALAAATLIENVRFQQQPAGPGEELG